MSSTAVQLSAPNATMPNTEQWQLLRAQAAELLKSRLLPASITTPEAVVAIIVKGRELGIPAMYALSNIVVIKGKPTCSAELMLALVKRDHGPDAIHLAESTRESCTLQYRSGTFEGRFTWDQEDAKLAGLWGQSAPWTQYPKAMLRARAISALVRAEFPDSIGGMYTAEELGAPVQMTDDGAIEIIVPPRFGTGSVGERSAAFLRQIEADGLTMEGVREILNRSVKDFMAETQCKTLEAVYAHIQDRRADAEAEENFEPTATQDDTEAAADEEAF